MRTDILGVEDVPLAVAIAAVTAAGAAVTAAGTAAQASRACTHTIGAYSSASNSNLRPSSLTRILLLLLLHVLAAVVPVAVAVAVAVCCRRRRRRRRRRRCCCCRLCVYLLHRTRVWRAGGLRTVNFTLPRRDLGTWGIHRQI